MNKTVFGILSLLLLLYRVGAHAQDGLVSQAHLLVMLEVPGSAPEARLEISGIHLRRDRGSDALTLLHDDWLTHERVAGQTRIVDQAISPGPLRALEITISSIVAPAGAAPVRPPVPEEPLRIPLEDHVDAGEAALVVLRWTPLWVEDDSTAYEVRIESVRPQIPPVGSLAFISNEGSDLISVLDTEELQVVDVIGAGRAPRELAYSPREQKLYCAVAGSEEVIAIDVLSRRLTARAQTHFGDEPSRLVLDRDETTLYCLNRGSSTLSAYGSYSLREKFRLDVGQDSRALAYDALTGFLYVSSEIASEVLVYDPVTRSEVARFSLDAQPGELEMSTSEQRLFVGTEGRRQVLVLDPRSGAELERMEICGSPAQLVWVPALRRLFASMPSCREVGISLPEEIIELGSIRLPDAPGRMAIESGTRRLLVTLPEADSVAVCNLGSRRAVAVVEVGRRPYSVVVP